MAEEYIDIGLTANGDADALREQALDSLRANIDGYEPADGNLEVLVLDAVAEMAADREQLLVDVSRSVFRVYGREVVGLPPIDEVAATAETTWTLRDSAGYTIPAQTQLAIGDQVFETQAEVVIPAGSTSAIVAIVAQVGGTIGNGLSDEPELLEQLAFVTSIALVAPTDGGIDAEADDAYEDRLAARLKHLGRPILPADFADRARDIAGVYRALAIDGYDPADDSYGNERMVTLAVIDADGLAVGPTVQAQVDTYLQAEREVNFVVNVIDPTYNVIDVAATIITWDDYDAATVTDAAETAITDFLSPVNFGNRPGSLAPLWENVTTLKVADIYSVLKGVDGVRSVTALTLNGAGADITLAGPAALTNPGTIAVTT